LLNILTLMNTFFPFFPAFVRPIISALLRLISPLMGLISALMRFISALIIIISALAYNTTSTLLHK
jgi:phage-related protein